MEELTFDFKRFFLRYKDLLLQMQRLEGKDGLIKQAFKEWGEEDFKNLFGAKIDRTTNPSINILLKQEQSEKKLISSKSKNSLRFFAPYYDKSFIDISKGKLPNFLRTKNIGLSIEMPKKSTDLDIMKKAREDYENLSQKEKNTENAKILRATAVVYARQANILNRFKESRKQEFSSTMKEKDIAMENFMMNAILYNNLVPEEKQIAFGISKSEARPCARCQFARIYKTIATFWRNKKMLAYIK